MRTGQRSARPQRTKKAPLYAPISCVLQSEVFFCIERSSLLRHAYALQLAWMDVLHISDKEAKEQKDQKEKAQQAEREWIPPIALPTYASLAQLIRAGTNSFCLIIKVTSSLILCVCPQVITLVYSRRCCDTRKQRWLCATMTERRHCTWHLRRETWKLSGF